MDMFCSALTAFSELTAGMCNLLAQAPLWHLTPGSLPVFAVPGGMGHGPVILFQATSLRCR